MADAHVDSSPSIPVPVPVPVPHIGARPLDIFALLKQALQHSETTSLTLFRKFDKNGNGRLEHREYKLFFQHLCPGVTQTDIDYFVVMLDVGPSTAAVKNHTLEFEELKRAVEVCYIYGLRVREHKEVAQVAMDKLADLVTKNEKKARRLFKKHDNDNSGCLDYVELVKLFRELVPNITLAELRYIMANVCYLDVDGNGRLTFKELKFSLDHEYRVKCIEEAEKARVDDEARKAEEERLRLERIKAEEEARLAAEAERQRLEEEMQRLEKEREIERQRMEEEAKRLEAERLRMEEEKRKLEEAEADAERRKKEAEEAAMRAEEDARRRKAEQEKELARLAHLRNLAAERHRQKLEKFGFEELNLVDTHITPTYKHACTDPEIRPVPVRVTRIAKRYPRNRLQTPPDTMRYSYYKYYGFAGRGACTSWAHQPCRPTPKTAKGREPSTMSQEDWNLFLEDLV
ncbi:hypothetical protein NFJ02_18g30950 [Pycnococcus provasolii]